MRKDFYEAWFVLEKVRVKQGTSSRLNQIKKKRGEIMWSETEMKGTWKKYFRDLYENDNGEKHLNTISAQEKN